jgi:FixJ family two-component response regulator
LILPVRGIKANSLLGSPIKYLAEQRAEHWDGLLERRPIALYRPTMNDEGMIHIIDDDESLRTAIGGLLRSVGHQVALYESTNAFGDSYKSGGASCILLDVRMPGVSGLDFQHRLLELGIRLPVIMMTGHGDIPMSVQAMKAGAIDFLPKPFREQDLLDAVSVALERDRARLGNESQVVALQQKFATLSPREREVMALVTAGKMNKQVAGDLGLSEITVKIHRGSAMRKMGARTLADLVKMSEALRLAS